jgi:polyribonucleotide nucleotidyltransferase
MAEESDILIEDDNVSEVDNEIQAPVVKRGRPPVPKPAPVYKTKEKTEVAVKKERTEAQKEATRKMLEARDKNRAERPSVTKVKQDLKAIRNQEIEQLKAQAVKEYQDSLVKKAISIKKKQIRKTVELDEISDDDTPMENIKKIMKKPVTRSQSIEVIKPTITFI